MVAGDKHGRRIYAVLFSSSILWCVRFLLLKARIGLFLFVVNRGYVSKVGAGRKEEEPSDFGLWRADFGSVVCSFIAHQSNIQSRPLLSRGSESEIGLVGSQH